MTPAPTAPSQCASKPASLRGTPRTLTLFLTRAAASPHLPPPLPPTPPPLKREISEMVFDWSEINPPPDVSLGTCFYNLPLK